jgi:hypothetical protein
MQRLRFVNNGLLSLIDLMTMGDSVKKDDNTKIGTYDSGLKYAVSLLLKNDVKFAITSGNNLFKFSVEPVMDTVTGKEKELVHITVTNLHSGEYTKHQTAFAKNLGLGWDLWMAIREIYSNCLDENGTVIFDDKLSDKEFDTVFELEVTPDIAQIIEDWDLYFTSKQPSYDNGNGRKIYKKKSFQPYTIYKNGIRIYMDEKISNNLFVYDDLYAEIDEMRVLRHLHSSEWDLCSMMKRCNDVDIINAILDNPESYEAKKLLTVCDVQFSETWVKVVNDRYAKEGEFNLSEYSKYIMKDPRFSIGYKSLLRESASYADKYETVKESKETPISFVDQIKLYFEKENKLNFKDVTVVQAVCTSSTKMTVGHPKTKTLYVNPDFFEIKDICRIDMRDIEFIKECYSLTDKDQIFHDFWRITKKR